MLDGAESSAEFEHEHRIAAAADGVIQGPPSDAPPRRSLAPAVLTYSPTAAQSGSVASMSRTRRGRGAPVWRCWRPRCSGASAATRRGGRGDAASGSGSSTHGPPAASAQVLARRRQQENIPVLVALARHHPEDPAGLRLGDAHPRGCAGARARGAPAGHRVQHQRSGPRDLELLDTGDWILFRRRRKFAHQQRVKLQPAILHALDTWRQPLGRPPLPSSDTWPVFPRRSPPEESTSDTPTFDKPRPCRRWR